MSRLLNNSAQFRDPMVAKNFFTINDEYNVGNSRALSDGDINGKGETDTIGSSIDIETRDNSIARNIYTANNPYDASVD